MVEPTTLLGVAKTVKKPLDDLYELGKGSFKKKLEKWQVNKNINGLYQRIAAIQKVNTIWQIEKEVNLKKFYYPSKLIIDDEPQTINQIEKIPTKENVVIQGTVGQGKSIFLRYLCSQELRKGIKIPVFFELRKIRRNTTLKQHLFEVLDIWGFDIDEDLFDFFANTGKFVLLLDGFDEIEPSLVSNLISELEIFSEKYPNLQIVITSRPDGGIEKSIWFKVFELAPLTEQDHEGVLNKLINNQDQACSVLNALSDSSTQIKELLTTPLMMTLLVFVYKAEQKIPEQFSDFYENLFQTLLMRHDKSKPGFVRVKNCPVNERKLQELFEAFCFLASQKSLTTMKFDMIHDLTDRALNNTKIDCDASDFIKDISKIACLVVEEGLDFHFIHKSVREYHAASFIKRRPESFAIKYYQSMLSGKWSEWRQELNFLSQVDEYRFTKYFMIPYIEDLFTSYQIDLKTEQPTKNSYKFMEVIDQYVINILKDFSKIVSFEFSSLDNRDFLDNKFQTDFHIVAQTVFASVNVKNVSLIPYKKELLKKIIEDEDSGSESVKIKAKDIITVPSLMPSVMKALSDKYIKIQMYYKERCKFIENEEKKSGMLDFD